MCPSALAASLVRRRTHLPSRLAACGGLALLVLTAAGVLRMAPLRAAEPPTPTWSRAELKALMKDLAGYVVAHHLRRDDSPMRGKVYEFYRPATGQQGYGAGWDTMHDGAWFATACVLAYRATDDPYYLEIVRDWIMPFYVKMLNQSDTLFPDRTRAFSDGQVLPPERTVAGKGFVPYFWDDGHGVNFDALFNKLTIDELMPARFGHTNTLADRTARDGRLAGYSHGTSNHLALDLFPMLANYWLLTRDPAVADALRNLRQSRRTQMNMDLPWLAISEAAVGGDADKAYALAAPFDAAPWPPTTPLYQGLVQKKRLILPAFLDDPAGKYYAAVIGRRVGPGTMKRFVQMVDECVVLADRWFEPQKRPRGLAYAADNPKPVEIIDGQFTAHAGDLPQVLVGSRMGAQTIWAAGVSLQLLAAFPDAWESYYRPHTQQPIPGWEDPPLTAVRARLWDELDQGLHFWQEQFRTVGYLRPDWPLGGQPPRRYWRDQTSETGGYAHVIAAAAQYLFLLDDRRDWEVAWSCQAPAAPAK